MSQYICKIERLANGYEVEMTDPAIKSANASGKGPWKDPEVCYAFSTVKEVLGFLEKNLEKAVPMDEYGSTFDQAAQEGEEEDDE